MLITLEGSQLTVTMLLLGFGSGFVLVRVSIPAQTSRPRSKLGRKGFIQLTIPYSYLSPKRSGLELKQGRKQELTLVSPDLLSLLYFLFFKDCCAGQWWREKDRHYLRVKGWKTIFQAKGPKKQAILISNKIDFQPKVIKKNKERHFILIKGKGQRKKTKRGV